MGVVEKTLKVALNNYSVVPHSLRENATVSSVKERISVNLASLYHHYYLDTYGRAPPNPDPCHFEYLNFLTPGKEFQFQGSGLGASSAAKRGRSMDLGQAFCRWFLYEHLNITYFAHMSDVLNRQLHKAFGGIAISRTSSGDAPDYFCAESVDRVFLGEAKGRYTPISFGSAEFKSWRKQFDRVVVRNGAGAAVAVKGHIVATRFSMEVTPKAFETKLYAEDPQSPGDRGLDNDSALPLGASILQIHYGRLVDKLNQPLLATALLNGVQLPSEILIQAAVWRLVFGGKDALKFIGGYYSAQGEESPYEVVNEKLRHRNANPFRLDGAGATFFGVEESIFRQIVAVARSTDSLIGRVDQVDSGIPFYSAVSFLRDGSIVGPTDFFEPVGLVTM